MSQRSGSLSSSHKELVHWAQRQPGGWRCAPCHPCRSCQAGDSRVYQMQSRSGSNRVYPKPWAQLPAKGADAHGCHGLPCPGHRFHGFICPNHGFHGFRQAWLPTHAAWLSTLVALLPAQAAGLPTQAAWLPTQAARLSTPAAWLPTLAAWLPTQAGLPTQRRVSACFSED